MRRYRGLALLSCVTVSGDPQWRETLRTLLWPKGEPSLAQSYVRRARSVLNKALGQNWMDADRIVNRRTQD